MLESLPIDPDLESLRAYDARPLGWITRTHRLTWLGPAFGTKLAYFAAFSADERPMEPRPLIADLNTSWAMWNLVRLARSGYRRDRYLGYVSTVHQWARDNDWRPDEVERALFEIGKKPR